MVSDVPFSLLSNPQGDVTTFSYDIGNRRTHQILANGVATTYVYDNADRLTQLASYTPVGATLTYFGYSYDNTANRTSVTDVDGLVTTWSYDPTYQLLAERRATGSDLDWVSFTLAEWEAFTLPQWETFMLEAVAGSYTTTYTYDPVGNRLTANDAGGLTTSTYDAANQLNTSVDVSGTTTYTYDLAGNQQAASAPSGITTSTWDNENRRTRVALPGGVVNTFSYNADGLRFQKQDSAGTTRFVWDGQAYLAETNAANATQVEYTQEPATYGGLLSQYRNTGALWVPSYYLLDGLGSTVRLTDALGSATDQYLYSAFGKLIASTGLTTNPFRWVGSLGYYFDGDLLDYYLRARFYGPAIGRFFSQDPIGTEARDRNLYRYVANNAVRRIDPSGLEDKCLLFPDPSKPAALDYWTYWKKINPTLTPAQLLWSERQLARMRGNHRDQSWTRATAGYVLQDGGRSQSRRCFCKMRKGRNDKILFRPFLYGGGIVSSRTWNGTCGYGVRSAFRRSAARSVEPRRRWRCKF